MSITQIDYVNTVESDGPGTTSDLADQWAMYRWHVYISSSDTDRFQCYVRAVSPRSPEEIPFRDGFPDDLKHHSAPMSMCLNHMHQVGRREAERVIREHYEAEGAAFLEDLHTRARNIVLVGDVAQIMAGSELRAFRDAQRWVR